MKSAKPSPKLPVVFHTLGEFTYEFLPLPVFFQENIAFRLCPDPEPPFEIMSDGNGGTTAEPVKNYANAMFKHDCERVPYRRRMLALYHMIKGTPGLEFESGEPPKDNGKDNKKEDIRKWADWLDAVALELDATDEQWRIVKKFEENQAEGSGLMFVGEKKRNGFIELTQLEKRLESLMKQEESPKDE